MTKNVGILELNYHSQNTYYLAKILNNKYNITLILNNNIKKKLKTFSHNDLTDITYEVWDESESKIKFNLWFKKIKEELDFLFICTPTGTTLDLFNLAQASSGVPSTTYIYKVYDWLAPKIYLNRHFRDVVRENLRSVAQQYLLSKQDALLSEYQTGSHLMTLLDTNNDIRMLRPLYRSDWSTSPENNEDNFRLAVPGAISRDRNMNYEELLKISEEFSDNIMIELLGRPKDTFGENIVKKAKSNPNFETYNKWIPHADFATKISTADILLAPFSRNGMTWKAGSRYERRGLSVGSGITLDAIKYSTPLLLPGYYTYDPELSQAVKTFDSVRELPSIVNKLTLDESEFLNNMNKGIQRIADKYSKTNQSMRFEKFINAIINKTNYE